MIELTVHGFGVLKLEHLVLDVEGTLTIDGQFQDHLFRPLIDLRDRVVIHLLTTDTYRQQDGLDRRLDLKAFRISTQPGGESLRAAKRRFVEQLGAETVMAVGQGFDDVEMLEAAGLGVCVLSQEGAASAAVRASDIVVPSTMDAVHLLTRPLRIVTTLQR
jgi:soluble P-type ATPase